MMQSQIHLKKAGQTAKSRELAAAAGGGAKNRPPVAVLAPVIELNKKGKKDDKGEDSSFKASCHFIYLSFFVVFAAVAAPYLALVIYGTSAKQFYQRGKLCDGLVRQKNKAEAKMMSIFGIKHKDDIFVPMFFLCKEPGTALVSFVFAAADSAAPFCWIQN
jgi:hypothetical protein